MSWETQYALIDEEEARRECRLPEDGADGELINDLLVEWSADLEAELDRLIVSRGTITEYHSFSHASAELYVHQWPIISGSVSSIHEDTDRSYGATSLLTENTDYIIDYGDGTKRARIIRVDGSSPRPWDRGFEAVKIVYQGGFTTASTPLQLKRIVREGLAASYRDITGQSQLAQSLSDGAGSFARFGPPFLTKEQRRRVSGYKRMEFPGGATYSRSTTA